jgi:hypothetical protein
MLEILIFDLTRLVVGLFEEKRWPKTVEKELANGTGK